MSSKPGLSYLLISFVVSSGCSQSPYSIKEVDDSSQASTHDNGLEINGIASNGMRVNGMRVNGMRVNGVESHLANVVSGTVTAISNDSTFTFTGSQLSGSTVIADMEDSSQVTFHIDAVNYSADVGTNLYTLSYWDGSNWSSACGTDSTGYYAPVGTQIPAVALADTWNLVNGANVSDPNKFTFSCVNAAIGKCVVWGYKRWTTAQECNGTTCKTQDLAFLHEACTRLVRADYCGNGVYHTVNGTGIDVYDSLNIQTRTGVSGYSLEAEWRYDGAHCIQHTRWNKADSTMNPEYATDLAYVTAVCPSRLAANDASCANPNTSHFFTQYGLADAQASRSFLREDSYLH